MAKRLVPINASELQLYKVLQRANLLSYFDVFVMQGGDDVSQLLEADEDEFLEIMSLVGMANKPLHVRRLQKSLQDWLIHPNLFQQPVVNTNPSVTDALPKELVLAVMNNEVPMPAAIANCPVNMSQMNKTSAIYKFNPAAAAVESSPAQLTASEGAAATSPSAPGCNSARMSTPPVVTVAQPGNGTQHSTQNTLTPILPPSVRPSSVTGVPLSEASAKPLISPAVLALSSSSAPTSPMTNGASTSPLSIMPPGQGQAAKSIKDFKQKSVDCLDEVVKHGDIEDAPSSTDSAATVPARGEVKSGSSPTGSTCDVLSAQSVASSQSPSPPPLAVCETSSDDHQRSAAANGSRGMPPSTNGQTIKSQQSPGTENDYMSLVVNEICELIKNFEKEHQKPESSELANANVMDLTVKIKKEYLDTDSQDAAPLRLSHKDVGQIAFHELSNDDILEQSRIFLTSRILTDQEVLINKASYELCRRMPSLLKNKKLLLPLARQVYHIMNKPHTDNNNENAKAKQSDTDNVLAEVSRLDVHRSGPVRSAKRTYQYVLDNLVKEGYALALHHVIASFQQTDAKRIRT